MRFFWKVLLIIIPLGSYWLYKKGSQPSPTRDTRDQPQQAKENETTSQSPPGVGSTKQIMERLTKIDGVTSRVAENLIEKGIYSKEALTALSRDELMDIKGIGPKRAEKILGI